MKNFSKNCSFKINFKLYVSPLMYNINTHNINGVRSKIISFTEMFKWSNMYVAQNIFANWIIIFYIQVQVQVQVGMVA